MEEPGEPSSNSVCSIMSLDSDTNQSMEELEQKSKAGKTEKELMTSSAQIAKIKSRAETGSGVSKTVDVKNTSGGLDFKIMDDTENDLKELNSERISNQMSRVVTQLEKHVFLDSEKESSPASVASGNKLASNGKSKMKVIETEHKVKDATHDTEVVQCFSPGYECVEHTEGNSAAEYDVKPISDVQIKVIDVPEDDDLFDFLKHPAESDDKDGPFDIGDITEDKEQEDIKKRELYRLLTEGNPSLSRMRLSNEETPYHSGEDNKSDSEMSYRSRTTEELHSESNSDHEESLHQHVSFTDEIESRPETPCKEEQMETETPVRVRKKPGRKPRLDKPSKKPKLAPGQLSEKTLEKLEKCRIATSKWLKDLEVPEAVSLEKPLRFDIIDLNPYLTCGLCKGYLYEASTITECMHTFCKNCIVLHCMEVSLHCPVCNILIHPTDPFVHIRLDRMIQDIVYKILPNVAETEMKNIKAFYDKHPEDQPKLVKKEPPELKSSPKEKEIKSPRSQSQMVSLVLESEDDTTDNGSIESLEKKFIRVTSCATIRDVCDFLRKKLGLNDNIQVDMFCCGDAIEEKTQTLEKIKKKFFSDEDCLMLLQYRLRGT